MSTLKGLKDRMELLNELSFYLRYKDQLIDEGWLTISDFFDAIDDIIKRYVITMLSEE